MTYYDDLSEKDWLKSIHATMRRSEGKRQAISFQLEADDVLGAQLAAILAAIEGLAACIAAIPAPVVNVSELPAPTVVVEPTPVNLAEIVQAISTMGTRTNPDAIADAIAARILPQPATEPNGMVEVASLLKDIAWKLQGRGVQAYGGGAVSFSPAGLNQLTEALAQGISGPTGPAPSGYDFVDNTYTGDNLTEVVYKTGGSGGTTVATITMTYDGDKLDTVTWS